MGGLRGPGHTKVIPVSAFGNAALNALQKYTFINSPRQDFNEITAGWNIKDGGTPSWLRYRHPLSLNKVRIPQ